MGTPGRPRQCLAPAAPHAGVAAQACCARAAGLGHAQSAGLGWSAGRSAEADHGVPPRVGLPGARGPRRYAGLAARGRCAHAAGPEQGLVGERAAGPLAEVLKRTAEPHRGGVGAAPANPPGRRCAGPAAPARARAAQSAALSVGKRSAGPPARCSADHRAAARRGRRARRRRPAPAAQHCGRDRRARSWAPTQTAHCAALSAGGRSAGVPAGVPAWVTEPHRGRDFGRGHVGARPRSAGHAYWVLGRCAQPARAQAAAWEAVQLVRRQHGSAPGWTGELGTRHRIPESLAP